MPADGPYLIVLTLASIALLLLLILAAKLHAFLALLLASNGARPGRGDCAVESAQVDPRPASQSDQMENGWRSCFCSRRERAGG